MKQLRFVWRFFVVVVFISMFTLHAHAGNVIYVDIGATGEENGSSWDDAYTDLQDALDVAPIMGKIMEGECHCIHAN